MMRVEAVIHVAMETRRAVEPWPYTDEYTASTNPARSTHTEHSHTAAQPKYPYGQTGAAPIFTPTETCECDRPDKTKRREHDLDKTTDFQRS